MLTVESGNNRRVTGVVLEDGRKLESKTVLIATGTFLGGEIFLGKERWPAGRIGEKSAMGLSQSFRELGFRLARLRTGTPPRLLKVLFSHKPAYACWVSLLNLNEIIQNSIDFSQFEVMPPDRVPVPFSFMTDQLPTYIGYTNDFVRELVEENLADNEHVKADASGPRYCPSLESKVIRFPQLHHRLFLEHEGLHSELIYPQGMSMTFPPDVQLKIMRAIKGLEKVEIAQPGYGVQYDFVDPKQLLPTLETKSVKGLYLAGQINGTTGYEEAAAQGLLGISLFLEFHLFSLS
ncbi:tRNA uridine 5-carboxymethylaminomethyl modification enzyme GidA [Teladorsagia circumcincta]|uniref:tRNA uridine 5-carboxymethylaminomethyl modification enzyme GidA n=1 Tax=Teladorsagia circumcincta TaxID=45464 RepID=A0A2G9UY99_TELCI|nr:tRNA uridine 5-carboxymethylaminomethyl modification enzyme GidA [Teladorsagia circumcincta]